MYPADRMTRIISPHQKNKGEKNVRLMKIFNRLIYLWTENSI